MQKTGPSTTVDGPAAIKKVELQRRLQGMSLAFQANDVPGVLHHRRNAP